MSLPRTRDVAREGARFSVWTMILGALLLVVVVLTSAMWIFGFGFFQRETADFRGETAERERVLADPDYRIANYEHFFDLCVAVQNKEAMIRSQEEELNTNPPATRVAQINANLGALRASRESLINRYNADAMKHDTRGRFQASNLPFQLNPNDEETQCASF